MDSHVTLLEVDSEDVEEAVELEGRAYIVNDSDTGKLNITEKNYDWKQEIPY